MTATTETVDYTQYVDKKVVLTKIDREKNEAVEIEGTIEAAMPGGVLIKPKGRVQFELVEADNIEQIVLAADTGKKIKAKKIKPVTLGQARSHLLERHAGTLSEVNAMSEEEAFSFHNSIDHVAADLGHVHGSKDKDEAEAESE